MDSIAKARPRILCKTKLSTIISFSEEIQERSRVMRRASVIGAVVLMWTAVSVYATEAPSVQVLLKQLKQAFEPSRPSVRTIVVTNTDPKGQVDQWQMGEARKNLANGKRILLVMQTPADTRGIADLIWERPGKNDRIFVYLPFIRRVREIQGMRAFNSFSETEFTYADLGFIPVHEGYKLLGKEVRNGVSAYKIEENVPAERIFYSRIITWVTVDTFLPLERDYYDVAGRLWKTEIFKEIASVDGVPTPMDVVMTDVQDGYKTEMKVIQVTYDTNIPDALFDPEQLSKVADSAVWRTSAQGK